MRIVILLLIGCSFQAPAITNDMYVRTLYNGVMTCEKLRVVTAVEKRSICLFIKEWRCYRVIFRYQTDTGIIVVAEDNYQERMSIRYIKEDDGIAIFISGKHQPNFLLQPIIYATVDTEYTCHHRQW